MDLGAKCRHFIRHQRRHPELDKT